MQFAVAATPPVPHAAAAPAAPAPFASTSTGPNGSLADSTSWKNPAAAAALQTSVDLLRQIEDGIVKHYNEVDKVRTFSSDLHQSNEMFASASDAVANDQSKDNDQFVSLINRASGGVDNAETRLASKDLASTWPSERSEILSAVRTAKLIATNVSRQLDPLNSPQPAPRD